MNRCGLARYSLELAIRRNIPDSGSELPKFRLRLLFMNAVRRVGMILVSLCCSQHRKSQRLLVLVFFRSRPFPSRLLAVNPSRDVSKIALGRVSPEWRHIPCAVGCDAGDQHNRPKHELCAHPPLPMFEPKPLWKKVCAGHDDDVESKKLSRHPPNCVYYCR